MSGLRSVKSFLVLLFKSIRTNACHLAVSLLFLCHSFALRILYFHLSFASALIEGNIFLNCALVEIMELPGKGLGALGMKFLRRKVSLGFLFFSSSVSLLITLSFDKGKISGRSIECDQ